MNTFTQPAYPVMPLQDHFQRLVVPVAGVSKLELFALEIFKCYMVSNADGNDEIRDMMAASINDAVDFLKQLDVKIKKLNDEKDNGLAIFDR
jgi:hypothetical protein